MPCLPTFDCHSIARTTTTRMTKSVVYRLLPRPIPHLPTLRLTLTQHLPGSHSLLLYFFLSSLLHSLFYPPECELCVCACVHWSDETVYFFFDPKTAKARNGFKQFNLSAMLLSIFWSCCCCDLACEIYCKPIGLELFVELREMSANVWSK